MHKGGYETIYKRRLGKKFSTVAMLMHHITFSTKASVRALSSEVVSILSSDLFHDFQVGLPMPIVAKTKHTRLVLVFLSV